MSVSEYKLLASAGVASIIMGFVGLIVGAGALGASVFGAGALFTVWAVIGALWFSGEWKRPRTSEPPQP